LIKQKEQADAMADDWYRRAQLALQAGNEGLAREALGRRQQQVEQAKTLQDQISVQAASLDKLYEGMQILESKILESKSKKDQMVARARTAQSTQKINDMIGGMTGKTSMDAFKRMEEKVEALEAAAEVSTEMGSAGGMLLPGSAASSVEQQFRLLEGSAAVDDELKKLKGLLTGGTTTTSSSSSGGNASGTTSGGSSSSAWTKSPVVDDELEQMKKEAGL
jgi:phage shock protein A